MNQSVLASLALCFLMAGCATSPRNTKSDSYNLPWDWNGIIGTGQSLSIGQKGEPVLSTNQPFGNLKLSSGNIQWPAEAGDTNFTLVPLTEPIGRRERTYPSSWPENIVGETPHSSMANELTTLVKENTGKDFVSVHFAAGEDGQGMVRIRKNPIKVGVTGRSYEAAMIQTAAIVRLAKAAGKSYGVGAVVLTHGETDSGNRQYEDEVYTLWSNYDADVKALTGQSQNLIMILSQQSGIGDTNGTRPSLSSQAEWKAGVDHPKEIVCSGPKYQYPYNSGDALHLTSEGYRLLGEKSAQVYFERVIRQSDWQPLQPVSVDHNGAVLTVHFHVPVGPLNWDTNMSQPHAAMAEWKNGNGFEVTATNATKITINSVSIRGDSVIITCDQDPGDGARLSYAMLGARRVKMTAPYDGTLRWGRLRDSDPFVGFNTGKAQPNYCVAFTWIVP